MRKNWRSRSGNIKKEIFYITLNNIIFLMLKKYPLLILTYALFQFFIT